MLWNGLPYWKLDNKRNGYCGDSNLMHIHESPVVCVAVSSFVSECVCVLCSFFSVTYCWKHCGFFCFAFTFCLFICVDYKRLAPQ